MKTRLSTKIKIMSFALSAISLNCNSQNWLLTGNAANSSNFIGTTNITPLNFRVNGFYSGVIDLNGPTFFGYSAGVHNTNNSSCGFGISALFSNTTGAANTAIGSSALLYNQIGDNNTAVGSSALYFNLANDNTAIGHNALVQNSSGENNTAIGSQALSSNQIGSYNTAIGGNALNKNTGYDNTATGYQSLFNNTTGSSNTASGSESLYSNKIGMNNTAIGQAALYNSTGNDNTALGFSSLVNNIVGINNTALGSSALYYNKGDNNTAIGFKSLYNNNSGTYNTASGAYALLNNTTGTNNTSTGFLSLVSNIVGANNTAMGYSSLYNNIGSNNTAIGNSALYTNNVGYSNTAIGNRAFVNGQNFSNSTALGNNSNVTASNQVVLGNVSITQIGAYVSGITNLSDSRFKKNVKEDVHGLDFIMKLKPVTYNLDVKKLNAFLGIERTKNNNLSDEENAKISTIEEEGAKEKEAIVSSGFLAQDVERAAKEVNYNFDGLKKPVNEKDHYGLNYTEFVVPLVKAVQEQQKMIDEQQKQNLEQQKQIDELKKIITTLCSNSSTETISRIAVNLNNKDIVLLNQNAPNPFAEQTVINYNIPQNVSNAQIVFYDLSGQLIKSVEIKTKGQGQLVVYSNDLSIGAYSYTLLIDGKVFETKKMIKSN